MENITISLQDRINLKGVLKPEHVRYLLGKVVSISKGRETEAGISAFNIVCREFLTKYGF